MSERSASAQRLQAAYAAMACGVVVFSPSGEIVETNEAAQEILGHSLAEMRRRQRQGARSAVARADGTALPNDELPWLVALRTHLPQRQVVLGVTRDDGQRRWLQVDAVPIFGDDGEPIQIVSSFIDVTTRVQAEETRRVTEERFRLLFSAAPNGMALATPEGRLLEVNDALCQMLGYTAPELLEQGTPVLTHHDDLGESRALMRRLLAGECQSATLEKRYLHRDGHVVWTHYTATLLRGAAGQPLYFIYHLQDITARKQAEETQAQLAAIVEASDDAIFGKTLDGVVTAWNGGAERLYGYSVAEMVGQSVARLIPPDRPTELAETMQAVARGETIRQYETERVRKDGTRVAVALTITPIRDRSGAVVSASVVARDITARKASDEALRASEERYRQVQEHAPIGLALVAPDGHWLRVNPALCALAGYSEDELLERTFQDITHPDDLDADLGYVRQMLAGELTTYQMEKRYIRKDGALVWVLLSVSLVRDGVNRPLYFISQIQDITARKRAEEALGTANRELEQFASIAAHDLRSPLNTIGGYAQLLDMRYSGQLDAKADEFIGFIVEAVQRMQQLIDDLLSYARLDTRAVPSESVDCATLVDRVVAGLRANIDESGAMVTHHGLPTLPGHATQLGQLFQNLIGNALKFRGKAPPEVTVSAERQGREWLFTVQDNGIGIPSDQLERIFAIFQRLHTRDEYEGTGIGLAVCKRIVERHGGRIWVESQVGTGTRFLFTLPAARRP